jgi:dolichyl-phosphate beta-glucosyltransferase
MEKRLKNNMQNKFDISIIIACYNEETHLKKNIKKIQAVLDQTSYSYEFIIIDDKSRDDTPAVISEIVKDKENFSAYFHNQNVGRGGTVREGLLKARGRYAGFLDIDLEVTAHYIPPIIGALEKGAGVATIHRIYKFKFGLDSLTRTIMSVGYRKLLKSTLHLPFQDTETGFKFFNSEKARTIIEKSKNPGWFWDTEIMALAYYHHLKVKEIPGLFLKNPEKQSTVKPFSDAWQYLKALWKFKKHLGVRKNRS